jgi:hypothetical protein
MTLSPIPKVLSTFLEHNVRALLIGGQACILYGGAEFSRDIDMTIMISPENLDSLEKVLYELNAERIFYPPLSEEVLKNGHACHFRCRRKDIKGLRIDVLGRMRNVAPFPELWNRRKEIQLSGIGLIPVIGLADLIKTKKTQRDKDWPMIRRLIEADIYKAGDNPDDSEILFWFSECRTPELLISLAGEYPGMAREISKDRPLISSALSGDREELQRMLREEEDREKEADRHYWEPLRKQLEEWRLKKES